ncbi:DUF2508 family protein [Lactobacillus sp. S2-2]|uniref:YaaL family protein n=1 Tax=Lactobacillus sp. S2-2 TaxID=2692917 RepID=UPI001F491FD9|nr:YaaL family protein [Lactobacillus sp. S2-2]MCF6515660.1 DUF2508 family protein [Lactobacillus sp. S2-2]
MFGKKSEKLKLQYDEEILEIIDDFKLKWNQAIQTEEAVYEFNESVHVPTLIAKRKYLFMYKQARKRNVKSNQIQSSIYDY